MKDIFRRILAGEAIPFNNPDYYKIGEACTETKKLLIKLNNVVETSASRRLLAEITGSAIDDSTTIFTPFQINYGKNTRIGKNVFINFNCTFLDLGGITIEDNVMLAPNVSLLTEGHPLAAGDRQTLIARPIHVKKNAWIGANATILQGVTIGENAVVAAGAVVSKDVPDNAVAGGIPAKIIKTI
ncbi:acetyltransferase-like isoleucine patch superfamily enzyme [Anseongella ginsenosidimutans]|uniref:Acetyltransferase-like isoleucine patch superfamily enzyme n=1 Tax=Anseongella ginsenosidimutans TaxID=496056 RepID=A0A4R3KND7_9SPHI|nr:DapH/DapD/GlmU-related protein [Anseongella ginsenosidimutans]QEC53721.1 sugar O-acetyltransferase [Anseongella ginsenosidimutans]TCS86025.1 acetyltransferase-like isoleucine patch superfamily enzyme [Anseongella ginsenosidimutans]